MNRLAALRDLYMRESKHSNYQRLPRRLGELLGQQTVKTCSRYEDERLAFITANIDLGGKTALDVGANTGFFAFEALDHGARRVAIYEGNAAHAEFLRCAAEVLGVADRVCVTDAYLDFPTPTLPERYDIGLLMNVLHHVGDDFGETSLDVAGARSLIGESLRSLARQCSLLVFQIGYCWKGDRLLPLFGNGTKAEQIDFVSAAVLGHWRIETIGIPVRTSRGVVYSAPDAENMQRRDDLGEFLNRPLFLLRSLTADT